MSFGDAVGYPLAPAALIPFDNLDALASVTGSSTATVRTITGKGSADIVLDGTGDVDVTIKYAVDGGAPVAIGLSNVTAYLAASFTTSLVITAVNANVAAKNRCGVSSTGVKQ